MGDRFSAIVTATLQHEGGYVCDPADPGGETKYGISRRSYPDLDIKDLTIEAAVEIYRRDFWQRVGIDRIEDGPLAAKTFDLAVNVGPGRAVRWLQAAVNAITASTLRLDGALGPKTARAVNACPHQRALLALVKHRAAGHYIAQQQPRFLPGWLNRLER